MIKPMRLVDDKEIQGVKAIRVFRESLAVHFFWPIALLVAATGVASAVASGALNPAMNFLAALFAGIGLVSALAQMPLLRRTNWLVMTTEHGMYVKYRSYLNRHLRDGQSTAVFIAYDELRGVRPVVEKRVEHFPPARRNHHRIQHIDLVLTANVDTAALSEAAAKERHLSPGPNHLFGDKLPVYPVMVPEPGVIRLEWKSGDSVIVPGIAKALALLGAHGEQLEPLTVHVDYANEEHHAQLEALLDDYVRDGKTARAMRIAQERYGLGAAEAALFVDDLHRKSKLRGGS
jgi:hypothetical protein